MQIELFKGTLFDFIVFNRIGFANIMQCNESAHIAWRRRAGESMRDRGNRILDALKRRARALTTREEGRTKGGGKGGRRAEEGGGRRMGS